MYTTVMSYMLFQYSHLSQTNPGTNITHPIVITYLLMLIVRVRFPCLRSVKHRGLFGFFIRHHQRTSPRGRDHLVPVKTQRPIHTESTTFLPLIFRSQRLCSILQYGNLILLGHGTNLVHLCRHPVQVYRNNCLRFPSGFCHPISYSFLQQYGVHVPSILFRIHKNSRCPQISHRIR